MDKVLKISTVVCGAGVTCVAPVCVCQADLCFSCDVVIFAPDL